MKIEHLAIWVNNLEAVKSFYEKYFQARAGMKYVNTAKKFESYFLTFDEGARLELMHMPGIQSRDDSHQLFIGISHFAISTGSTEKVDNLTEQLRLDGYEIIGEPRTTGDGYYESVVLDPEGNSVEITV
ncbi:MAG: VOC family protein [Cyclobacteriaceae bacterium]|nr:VOC family protein [Cyclobacteriaceae bacterium]